MPSERRQAEGKMKGNTLVAISVLISILILCPAKLVADTGADDSVPLTVIQKVALEKAKSLWGEVSAGQPIPCYDENGELVVYMCPFHIGDGVFPMHEKVLKGVKEGRKWVEEVRKNFYEQGERISPDTAAAYQKTLKEAKKKELGIGEFGTIYVSARYDFFPIPLVSHYLPPYYTKLDLAEEKAAKVLGGDKPVLVRYYFLGHRGQYFEFEQRGKKKLLQAYSLEEKGSFVPAEPGILSEKEREDNRSAWRKLQGSDIESGGGE